MDTAILLGEVGGVALLGAVVVTLAVPLRSLERFIVRRTHNISREDLATGRVRLVRQPDGVLLPEPGEVTR